MKKLTRKIIATALLLGMHLPAYGYKWTLYNGLGKMALFQTNVSGQVMRAPIAAGSSAVFNYDAYGGWHNILNMSGLCLTTIYAQPMGETEMKPAHLKVISRSQLTGIFATAGIVGGYGALTLPALFAAVSNPEGAIGALIAGAIIAIIAAAIILSKLCNSGDWLIVKDKDGVMHSIRVTT